MFRVVIAAAAFLSAFASCREPQERPPSEAREATPEAAAVAEGPPLQAFPLSKAKAPLGLEVPHIGADRPLLVVLEVVDYSCPDTRAVQGRIDALLEATPEVGVYVLHDPLPDHPDAELLAAAATAAQLQGRFPQMHRALLAEESVPDRNRLVALARGLELDVPRFLEDLRRDEVGKYVEGDRVLVAGLGVPGAPVFFIGGVPVQGVPSAGRLEALVDDRLAKARKLQRGGLGLQEIHQTLAEAHGPYHALVVTGVPPDETPEEALVDSERLRWRVPVREDDAILGAPNARVTVVVYLDFDCKHSRATWRQLRALYKGYSAVIRLVPRVMPHTPLAASLGAARFFDAARAASRGIDAVDRLFVRDPGLLATLEEPPLEEALRQLGWYRAQAEALDALGTPTIFVNGIRRQGALSAEELTALVDRELEIAQGLVDKGVPDPSAYLTRGGHLHRPAAAR